MRDKGRILLVDDEPNTLKVVSSLLADADYQVSVAQNVESAIRRIQNGPLDVVVSDMKMPGQDGMVLCNYLHHHFPEIPIIFLSAYASVEAAVEAMAHGAYYYLVKPPDFHNLRRILAQAVEEHRIKQSTPGPDHTEVAAGCRLLGKHPAFREVLRIVKAVKDSDSSVLLCGETGTGKEFIARSLHYLGRRKERPFVAMNCAAIPAALIESELFGCEKGAFTGAVARRIGRVEQAAGGTLFLDEIGELDPAVQAKFLRVLQEKEVERLGGGKKIGVDFRLISSTNRDLATEVREGLFREDLFYRVNVVEIRLPALRERREDIPLLAQEFVREFCRREGKSVSLGRELLTFLRDYHWPGNIRQLRNVIERAVVLARTQKLTLNDLPQELLSEQPFCPVAALPTMKQMEISAVTEAVLQCGGNKSRAAQLLGISRKALYKRLSEAGAGEARQPAP